MVNRSEPQRFLGGLSINEGLSSQNPAVQREARAILTGEHEVTRVTAPSRPAPTPSILPAPTVPKQVVTPTLQRVPEVRDFGDFTITDSFPGNELVVRVTIRNTTKQTQEYRALLFTQSGTLIDKEPDLSFVNIRAGATKTLTLETTLDPFFSVKNIGLSYSVRVVTQAGHLVGEKVRSISTGAVTDTGRIEGEFLSAPTIGTPVEGGLEQVSLTPITREAAPTGFDFPGLTAAIGTGGLVVVGILVASALFKK